MKSIKNLRPKSEVVTPVHPFGQPRPCPECGKPSTPQAFPFCSPRCRAVDLNRWLSGSYVIAGEPLEQDEEDGADLAEEK